MIRLEVAVVIRWLFLIVFMVSLVTLFVVRGEHTHVAAEGGRYFIVYKSSRTETSREVYEAARADEDMSRWRGAVRWGAVITMIGSIVALAGVQAMWMPRRRRL